ncbi:MAG: hypothetical protein WCT02_00825 [Candidatus Paceibacterota bacterium]|jgi:hypothetical protein
MIKQLALCALAGFLAGIVVYFVTAFFIGEKKTDRLPGGALGAGVFTGMMMGTDIVVPAVIVAVLAALVGHILCGAARSR